MPTKPTALLHLVVEKLVREPEPQGLVGTIQGGQFYYAFPERYMCID